MQVTALNSISPEFASSPTMYQSSVQRAVDSQVEADFAQLASASSQEPTAASSTGNSSGGNSLATGDVLKAISTSILNNIVTQAAEDRAKLEKLMRGEEA